jgi:hypothetical protein
MIVSRWLDQEDPISQRKTRTVIWNEVETGKIIQASLEFLFIVLSIPVKCTIVGFLETRHHTIRAYLFNLSNVLQIEMIWQGIQQLIALYIIKKAINAHLRGREKARGHYIVYGQQQTILVLQWLQDTLYIMDIINCIWCQNNFKVWTLLPWGGRPVAHVVINVHSVLANGFSIANVKTIQLLSCLMLCCTALYYVVNQISIKVHWLCTPADLCTQPINFDFVSRCSEMLMLLAPTVQ